MDVRTLKLCLVTNIQDQSFSLYKPLILKAIHGGVTSIQLRAKTQNVFEFRQLALQLKSILHPFKIPLILNDHVEVACEIDADGVHIGQSDLSPSTARKILGPHKIIGLSVESLDEVKIANQLNCIDYIAASAVFPSKTKQDCKTIWGIDGLKQITALSKHPVIAIGGITLKNIDTVMESGVCGAAVISAIHDDSCPQQAVANLITAIDCSLNKQRQHHV